MKRDRENVGISNLQPKRISPRRAMQEVNRNSPSATKRDRNRSTSTVVSPSKVRHKLFVEQVSKLTPGQQMVRCPECSSPSPVSSVPPSPPLRVRSQRAECSSTKCGFVFCPECKCEEHLGPAGFCAVQVLPVNELKQDTGLG